jgi:hypothetical protein
VQRYFEEFVQSCRLIARSAAASCGRSVRLRRALASAFAVECESAARSLRPPEQFGVKIRRAR